MVKRRKKPIEVGVKLLYDRRVICDLPLENLAGYNHDFSNEGVTCAFNMPFTEFGKRLVSSPYVAGTKISLTATNDILSKRYFHSISNDKINTENDYSIEFLNLCFLTDDNLLIGVDFACGVIDYQDVSKDEFIGFKMVRNGFNFPVLRFGTWRKDVNGVYIPPTSTSSQDIEIMPNVPFNMKFVYSGGISVNNDNPSSGGVMKLLLNDSEVFSENVILDVPRACLGFELNGNNVTGKSLFLGKPVITEINRKRIV